MQHVDDGSNLVKPPEMVRHQETYQTQVVTVEDPGFFSGADKKVKFTEVNPSNMYNNVYACNTGISRWSQAEC